MTGAREASRHDAAQRYAAHGWAVFPLIPGEKRPVTTRGFLDASTDPERISSWWKSNPDRNVGIATGAPGPDVVDVDKHAEGNGFAAFGEAQRAGLIPAPMATVRTPSGGFHAYFTGTDQRSASIKGRHLDFRSQGGYVVAPPSAVSGRRYEVVSHQPSDASVDFGAIRSLIQPPEPQPKRQRERQDGGRPKSVEHLAGWVAGQPEGNRNAGLFWAANRAVEAGDAAALESISKAAQSAGLDAREVDRTIKSAQRTVQPEPRPFPARQAEREAG